VAGPSRITIALGLNYIFYNAPVPPEINQMAGILNMYPFPPEEKINLLIEGKSSCLKK